MLAGFGFVFNKTHHSSLKRKAEFKSIEDNDKLIQSKRKTSSSLEPRTATRPAVGLGPRGSFLLVTGSCGDWPGPCLGEVPVLIAGKNRSGRGHSPRAGVVQVRACRVPRLGRPDKDSTQPVLVLGNRRKNEEASCGLVAFYHWCYLGISSKVSDIVELLDLSQNLTQAFLHVASLLLQTSHLGAVFGRLPQDPDSLPLSLHVTEN